MTTRSRAPSESVSRSVSTQSRWLTALAKSWIGCVTVAHLDARRVLRRGGRSAHRQGQDQGGRRRDGDRER